MARARSALAQIYGAPGPFQQAGCRGPDRKDSLFKIVVAGADIAHVLALCS